MQIEDRHYEPTIEWNGQTLAHIKTFDLMKPKARVGYIVHVNMYDGVFCVIVRRCFRGPRPCDDISYDFKTTNFDTVVEVNNHLKTLTREIG